MRTTTVMQYASTSTKIVDKYLLLNHPLSSTFHTAPTLDSNLTLSVKNYLDNEAIVQVDWGQVLLTENYSMHLFSINHSNVTTTNNNLITVMVSYNNEYNFSLVASNCKGSSTLFSTTFTVGK